MFTKLAAIFSAVLAIVLGSGAVSMLTSGEAGYPRLLGLIFGLGSVVLLLLALFWFSRDS